MEKNALISLDAASAYELLHEETEINVSSRMRHQKNEINAAKAFTKSFEEFLLHLLFVVCFVLIAQCSYRMDAPLCAFKTER